MDLQANILSVTFSPTDFVEIHGMVWSNFRSSRYISGDNNCYSEKWFWSSSLPEPVTNILTEAANASTAQLVEDNALPTFWPAGLMEEEQQYPFNLTIQSFKIFNRDWDGDKRSEAKFKISSNSHLGPEHGSASIIYSTVGFYLGHKIEKKIFKILEEHM